MPTHFHHEELVVYQRAVDFVAWSEGLLQEVTQKVAAKQQLRRASGSVPQNIAESNAKRGPKEQRRFIDIANGSALESAACLGVLEAKDLVAEHIVLDGKGRLQEIVRMLYGLRRSKSERIAEDGTNYGNAFFDHEKLDAYQKAIQFVGWIDGFCRDARPDAQTVETLDRSSTSIPLNIAEGNAKFSGGERCRFLDIAISSSLRCAAALDVLVARGDGEPEQIDPGKELLGTTVSLLSGLRSRIVNDEPNWEN